VESAGGSPTGPVGAQRPGDWRVARTARHPLRRTPRTTERSGVVIARRAEADLMKLRRRARPAGACRARWARRWWRLEAGPRTSEPDARKGRGGSAAGGVIRPRSEAKRSGVPPPRLRAAKRGAAIPCDWRWRTERELAAGAHFTVGAMTGAISGGHRRRGRGGGESLLSSGCRHFADGDVGRGGDQALTNGRDRGER